MDDHLEHQTTLRQFIATEAETLLSTLTLYVVRAGLAHGPGARETALELQSDVVVEALNHADRFDSTRQPLAWLLGIAANLIKRRQVAAAKQNTREPLARDMYAAVQDQLSEDELFDRIVQLTVDSPAQDVEAVEQAQAMLALLPEPVQATLQLAVLHGLSGEALASALGTTPGAARVRLHRALNQLREVWNQQLQQKDGTHDQT